MGQLWKWIVVFCLVCLSFPFVVPSEWLAALPAPPFGRFPGVRAIAGALWAVALVTLVRSAFRHRLPVMVAGSTAVTALLFILGHIVYFAEPAPGLGVFALALFFGLLNVRVGFLYGEEISATKESSHIHLSQAVEFLIIYAGLMMRFLPGEILGEIWQSLLGLTQGVWQDLRPILVQVWQDLSGLL